MDFYFKSFQFNSEQRILTNEGSVVPLNDKALQLLALFLKEPNKVLTKSEILDRVWPNRYVSDQVIFQNVSHLRALFGSDSIKTFKKKGYQWQLPFTNEPTTKIGQSNTEAATNNDTGDIGSPLSIFFNKNTPRLGLFLIAVFAFFTLYVVGYYFNQNNRQDGKALDEQVQLVSLIGDQLDIIPLNEESLNNRLFDSPFIVWKKQVKNDEQLVLGTKVYPLESGVALRFHLQGLNRGWHDYIEAENETSAYRKLNQFLSKLLATDYFSISSEHAALAELILLSNKNDTNVLIDSQIIKQNFKLKNLDQAHALIEKNLQLSQSKLRQGILYSLKTDIKIENLQWLESKELAIKSVNLFRDIEMPQLEANTLIKQAWYYLVKQDFRQGMKILNRATMKARLSQEPLIEVQALSTHSFFAAKNNQMDMSYSLIDLAREVLSLHQLGNEHAIPLYSNLAWITKSKAEAIEYQRRILNAPYNRRYDVYFYNAARKIRSNLIEEQDYKGAELTIRSWQNMSFQNISRAHIAFAQQQWAKGISLTKDAFLLAQTKQQKYAALDAALLLVKQSSSQNSSFDNKEYRRFITNNAPLRWIDQNKLVLKEMNIAVN